ncbi:MAG TPA: bacillithiol biosynthesis deacetylase BshB1 [Planctomycetaceae bacterium]|nr:bacillithiol biosynthesis deacetylase BshB1 [Planctomycetaceae bacterium]
MSLDVLVVAPHPDDAELGAGGAILKLREAGRSVGVLDLTDGEPTPHGSVEVRRAETAAATSVLQLDWRGNLELPNRSLEPTLEARRRLAEVFRELRPTWLCAPYWEDAHPDHVAATQLIEAARFWSKLTKTSMKGEPWHPSRIYYYYCVHLRQLPRPAFVLDISEQWEKKAEAIACYRSQFIEGRDEHPSFLERLQDEAAFWGKMIGCRYGEPWTSREVLGLRSLASLL